MGSVNRVTLVGHLGADPELKYGKSGKALCNMRIATNETWKDKSGAKQEKTEWHRVVVFGENAENAAKFLKKSSECYIEGRLETRMYERDGQKHYATEIIADRVVFLGGSASGGARRPGRGVPDSDPNNGYETAGDDDATF